MHSKSHSHFLTLGGEQSMPAVTVDMSSQVKLGLSVYTLLNTNLNPCSTDSDIQLYSKCVINTLEDQLIIRNATCIPIMLSNILPKFENKICTDGEIHMKMTITVTDILFDIENGIIKTNCGRSCETYIYDTKKYNFAAGTFHGKSKYQSKPNFGITNLLFR